MLKTEKRKHVENLMDELADEKVEVLEGESPYFTDYLYGVSDVKEEIEEFLDSIKSDEWILLYQVLVNTEPFKEKEYYLYCQNNGLYFLMRNEKDLDKFKKNCLEEREVLKKPHAETLTTLFTKYKGKFKDEKDEGLEMRFHNLLENYFTNKEEKESEEYTKATYDLGEFLKTCKRKGNIDFKQADFFKDELGFNDPKIYPKIRKKHKELMPNG